MAFDQCHTASINYVDWCMNDTSLIITAGRDNKVIVWNYKTGEFVSGIEIDEPALLARWSPKIPSIFGISTVTGNISINCLNNEIEDHVPRWYLKPVGANFGPNNKLITFKEENGTVINEF